MVPTDRIDNYQIIGDISCSNRLKLCHARSLVTGGEVVLQCYMTPPGSKAEFREKYIARYVNECQWLLSVRHPNIIESLDYLPPDQERDCPVLVIEKLERTLEEVYEDAQAIDPRRIVEWMVQILTGINEFHRRKIIHRDIKPGNIMFDRFGTPKIIDLSIAVQIGQEITVNPSDITPQYAPAEMYHGSTGANYAIDIYSTGFMFYKLLCGKERFEALFRDVNVADPRENMLRWMNWHNDLNTDLMPLDQVAPETPPFLSAIIMKMTSKRLLERHQSTAEVIEDLLHPPEGGGGEDYHLIINRIISRDYWRDPAQYMLNTDLILFDAEGNPRNASRKKASPETAAGDAPPRPDSKRALAWTLLAVLLIALAGLGGFKGWQAYKARRIMDALNLRYGTILKDYAERNFNKAEADCGDSLKLIQNSGQAPRLGSAIQTFKILNQDCVDYGGHFKELTKLQSELRDMAAMTDLAKAKALGTQIVAGAGLLAALPYSKGERPEAIHKETDKHHTTIQDEAGKILALARNQLKANEMGLVALEAVRTQIAALLEAGKHRKAQYLILANTQLTTGSRLALLGEITPVVELLNKGRRAEETKDFDSAREAFARALELSKKRSLEAEDHLANINLWSLNNVLVDPAPRPTTSTTASLSRRLIELNHSMGQLFILKYDLEQRSQETEDALASLQPGLEALGNAINTYRAAAARDRAVFSMRPSERFPYPVEDSEAYLNDILTQVKVLKFRLLIANEKVDGAGALYEELHPVLSPADNKYLQARVWELAPTEEHARRALALYAELLREYPRWAEIHFRCGLVHYYRLKDLDKAMAEFQQALQLSPQSQRIRFDAAKAFDLAAQKAISGRIPDPDNGRRLAEGALQLWPDFPRAYLTIAMSHYVQHDSTRALEYLDKFEAAQAKANLPYALALDGIRMLPDYREKMQEGKGASSGK